MPGRCPGFIACWPSQSFPDEMQNIPSGQDACCTVVLTLCGLDRLSCGALSPVGWDTNRFWVVFCWTQLQHRVFPQFLMFLGFITYPCQCFRIVLGSGDQESSHKSVKSSNYRNRGLLHELVL